MSSVQTGQLISLLINNVLMVIIVIAVTLAAWLRWHWLQATVWGDATRAARRRCRWAYVSFMLTVVTLLGMLASLGILALRAMIAFNVLVMGAMGIFLLSVITLLLALGLWFVDLCSEFLAVPVTRRPRQSNALYAPPMALLPAAFATGTNPRRKRAQRRQRR